MSLERQLRAMRAIGGFSGGSRLARPPAVLEPADVRPWEGDDGEMCSMGTIYEFGGYHRYLDPAHETDPIDRWCTYTGDIGYNPWGVTKDFQGTDPETPWFWFGIPQGKWRFHLSGGSIDASTVALWAWNTDDNVETWSAYAQITPYESGFGIDLDSPENGMRLCFGVPDPDFDDPDAVTSPITWELCPRQEFVIEADEVNFYSSGVTEEVAWTTATQTGGGGHLTADASPFSSYIQVVTAGLTITSASATIRWESTVPFTEPYEMRFVFYDASFSVIGTDSHPFAGSGETSRTIHLSAPVTFPSGGFIAVEVDTGDNLAANSEDPRGRLVLGYSA